MKGIKSIVLGAGMAIATMLSCSTGGNTQLTESGLNPAAFDTTINYKPVKLFTLKNKSGMEVCITNFGGRVVSLTVPDKDGKPTDVVLGYDNIRQYADSVNKSERLRFYRGKICQQNRQGSSSRERQGLPAAAEQLRPLPAWRSVGMDISGV